MKKLYRSAHDRKILGICGGIGEYFNTDPAVIRLGLAAITLLGGCGIFAYIVAAIMIPEAPADSGQEE